MEKPSKFTNSSFHKESRSEIPLKKTKAKTSSPKDEFFTELVETGRPNWKKAPSAVKKRYNGIFLILFSIPILLLPGWELYRRINGTSTKKVQEGEVIEGKKVRKFDEAEKWQVEKNSIMYKIFGKDFFLDGFTSKTMHPEEENPKK